MKILFLLITFLYSANLHFDLIKKGDGNNTLLVIGGIHGNEPGGYYAPMFLIRHYQITKGSLWVVPNLNFDSIVEFKRGKYGDMNRKFARISKTDKDYKIVSDIKKLILAKNVKMILNLHDGHGFYRKSWQNSIFNPSAWGQACIIDQDTINAKDYPNLGKIASTVAKNLNSDLKKEFHIFNVKNTKTKFKDEQMRLSLTYFAITHNKAAFAIETSKNIKELPLKIYYQLRAIEEFMKVAGIGFKRDFKLNIQNIKKILAKNEYVYIDKTILPLKGLKKEIYYFPITKHPKLKSDNPLVVLIKKGGVYYLQEAYNIMSIIHPFFVKNKCKLSVLKIKADDKTCTIKPPAVIKVHKYFKVLSNKRVNVIGYSTKGNESNVKITKDMLLKRFSVDKEGRIYRVEIYEGSDFCGMVLVEFI
ncbi:MAG: hypothetical protein GXO62_07760 [Epsilonproteobacteria bacterium]|nr:hypothetical protein [Campylobacterota bacterium]